MFQPALIQRLLADPAVKAMIDHRASWLVRPQAERLPSITLQVIGGDIAQHMKGVQSLQFARVQMDCWGADYLKVSALIAAALTVLLPPATIADIRFRNASATTPRDFSEQVGTAIIFRKQTDLTIRFSPA